MHTFSSLTRRLSQAGFKKDFVRTAILPDWWEDPYSQDLNLLPDIELRVARFLNLPLSVVRDPRASLSPPRYGTAQLRRVRDIDRDRLGPAIHAGTKIAEATVRNLRKRTFKAENPPPDGLSWRRLIAPSIQPVSLDSVLADLWERDIPVVALDILPTPNFQAMVCITESRPVILLGHKHDEPGHVAFLVAHEVGHIVSGDCTPETPVVDEEGTVRDDAEIERRADTYAVRVLTGRDSAPDGDLFQASEFDAKELARRAVKIEEQTGADAGFVIFAWASSSHDYVRASLAVKALYRGSGARRALRRYFENYVDIETANESDQRLLRCAFGDPERDATIA